MEHLYLKNFGPIKEMHIDLKPLMVFIGESSSGKSAILKLLSLLRWVHKQNNLRTYFVKSSIAKKKSDYSRLKSDNLLKTSGLNELVRKDTEISFQKRELEMDKTREEGFAKIHEEQSQLKNELSRLKKKNYEIGRVHV